MAAGEKKIVVTQVRSDAGRDRRFRDTVKALGLGKIGRRRELTANSAVSGMLAKVASIVKVERSAK